MTRRRLRAALLVFFLALAIPTALLVWHAYDQLKWEAFYRFRLQAEELTARVDSDLAQALRGAESRGFADYAFLVVTGDPSANFFERSPLARFPVDSPVPGTLGYFQVDPSGQFSSPLVPEAGADATQFGVADDEFQLRQDLAGKIHAVLKDNELVEERPAELAELSAELALGRSAEQPNAFSSAKEGVGKKAMSGGADALDEMAPKTTALPQAELEEAIVSSGLPAMSPAPAVAEPMANQAFVDLAEADSATDGPSARLRQQAKTSQAPLRKVEELRLDSTYAEKRAPQGQRRSAEVKLDAKDRSNRKEQVFVPESGKLKDADDGVVRDSQVRISTFESEVSPYEFRRLGSGHFVLFRQVWRGGERYIQGMLIDQRAFVLEAVQAAFSATALYDMSDLVVAYQGGVLTQLSGRDSRYPGEARDLTGALLHRARLTAPLDTLELIFSINRLPAGPGGPLLGWVTGILVLVSCVGFFMVYRYGIRQIELARQQQDFVSAVSHELKTPLTSIRMYGEMLKEGWAEEGKRQTYYNYIYDESERLSRLIENVLQLARMSRNELQVETRPIAVTELMDIAQSKVESQVERAGFDVRFNADVQVIEGSVDVDADAFTQILINLVDNALKFSRDAGTRTIEIAAQAAGGQVMFSVRDFGPGVPPAQMKKIFKLFYRLENELTRETVGTGIGLALVHQLSRAMGGNVDVINREPGAEFRVFFPLH
jgi:signal transduction histidine kinase